jgi:hypothetical protein
MLIMQVYHDSGRIFDSDCKSQLQLHFLTPVVPPDFGHASRLRSMSVPHVLRPQLWKASYGRARRLQHLTAWRLSQKQTERDTWLVQRSKPQYLMASHVQVLGNVPRDQQTLSPTWSERNSSIQKDSIPLQLGPIIVFECLVKRAKALCRTTMALRTDHTWEKSLAQ